MACIGDPDPHALLFGDLGNLGKKSVFVGIARNSLSKRGNLFVEIGTVFDSSYETSDLAGQVGVARMHFEAMLERLGLQQSDETTS